MPFLLIELYLVSQTALEILAEETGNIRDCMTHETLLVSG